MRKFAIMFLCAVMLVVVSCGDGDDEITVTNGVQFPAINPATAALFCIRGNAVPPQTVSGTVTDDDCHTGIANDGFWESWRVRVASSSSVTFAASSSFDNWLELFRVDDLNDIEGSAVLLAEDDDSGTGVNALITFSLQPNTEYVIVPSGFDDSQRGAYSVSMTVN